jgi:hypothetical protein
MSSAWIVAIVLASAAVLGAWRTARSVHAHRTLRILLQFVAAVLVYFLLFPPSTDERFDSATLVVLTPGVSAEQSAKSARRSAVVA